MSRISIRLPERLDDALETAVELGYYHSKSEAIRDLARQGLFEYQFPDYNPSVRPPKEKIGVDPDQ